MLRRRASAKMADNNIGESSDAFYTACQGARSLSTSLGAIPIVGQPIKAPTFVLKCTLVCSLRVQANTFATSNTSVVPNTPVVPRWPSKRSFKTLWSGLLFCTTIMLTSKKPHALFDLILPVSTKSRLLLVPPIGHSTPQAFHPSNPFRPDMLPDPVLLQRNPRPRRPPRALHPLASVLRSKRTSNTKEGRDRRACRAIEQVWDILPGVIMNRDDVQRSLQGMSLPSRQGRHRHGAETPEYDFEVCSLMSTYLLLSSNL